MPHRIPDLPTPRTTIDERVLRVVATAIEGLIRSRPRMDPGFVVFGPDPLRQSETVVEVYYSRRHHKYDVSIRRSGERSILLTKNLADEGWVFYGPSNISRNRNISQKRAEEIAATAFTRGYPIGRVSDLALDYADRKLQRAAWAAS